MARAKQTCEDYDYLIVPPWGAVSYQHPEHWSDENRHPPMNPWTNYARHMTILGLALDWMGHDRVLLPPMEHMQNGTAVDWVKSALEPR